MSASPTILQRGRLGRCAGCERAGRTITRTTSSPLSRRMTGTFDRGVMLYLLVARRQPGHKKATAVSVQVSQSVGVCAAANRVATRSFKANVPWSPLLLLAIISPPLNVEVRVVSLDLRHVVPRLPGAKGSGEGDGTVSSRCQKIERRGRAPSLKQHEEQGTDCDGVCEPTTHAWREDQGRSIKVLARV